jgi:3'-5' exoribonuclease
LKRKFAEQIRERDQLDDAFLVRDKITAMAKNGKPYLTLKLMDRTGEIEGRVWDRVDELGGRFERDDFIRVQGKASVYLGKMQLVVQDLERLEDAQVDLADFLPVAERSREAMLDEVRQLVATMTDPPLRALMESFLADEEFVAGYAAAPAAKAIHHVYLGGLLEHSLAVARLADDICRRYPGVHRDLLVTGALLHDMGKISELCYERAFGYTDAGKLLGHIVIGVEMLERQLTRLPEFPPTLATLLKHLLLSHHGQYEFGSPKRPKTLEAVILNYVDDLDSKINGVQTHISREPDNTSAWTGYHRIYDRYFYKETPASDNPAGVPEEPAAELVSASAVMAAETVDKKRREPADRRRGFGTLGDQLRDKNLDLFGREEER